MTPNEWINMVIDHAELIVRCRSALDRNARLVDLQGFIQRNPYETGSYGDPVTQRELDDDRLLNRLNITSHTIGNETYGNDDVYQGETIAPDAESIINQILANPRINADEIVKIVTEEIANSSADHEIIISDDEPESKLDQRLPLILKEIELLEYPPLCIPYKGKSNIKKKCLSKYPDLFTNSTFDLAWRAGKKTNPQLWEVAEVEKYKE